MRLTDQTILTLCRMRDPIGVVSVYAATTPERQSHATPEWVIAIRNELKQMRQRAKDAGPRDRWSALSERLDALEPEIERLLDPKLQGRGRAMFAPVSGEDVFNVALQMPFPDTVVFEDTAYIRPLVAALDEGRPSGVAAIDRSGIRLLEWRFGEAEEVESYDFNEATGEWRRLEGPAAANPAKTQHHASQRDLFEERLDDHIFKFLKTTAHDEVQRHLKDRGWDRLVVSGEGRLTQPFLDGLSNDKSAEVIRIENELRQISPHEIAGMVTPLIAGAQRDRELALVETVKERALGGGQGTLGLRDTLQALSEGRVQHLVYDDACEFTGYRTSDGLLFAEMAGAGVPEEDLTEDAQLVERMIERAFETSASVTPVEQAAAEALADHDGVGALLRW